MLWKFNSYSRAQSLAKRKISYRFELLQLALLVPDHVVDHFGGQSYLANPSPAEQAGFAVAFEWHQHIDDLYPRLEDLRFGGTLY